MRALTARGTRRKPTPRVSRAYIPGKLDGWVAQYSLNGQQVRRFYSAERFGALDAARAAALADVRDQEPERDEFVSLRRRLLRRKNNRTGIPGLFFSPTRPGRGAFWVAFWTDETGAKRQKKFAESAYGPEEARRLATLARAAMVRQDLARLRVLADLLGVDLEEDLYINPDEF